MAHGCIQWQNNYYVKLCDLTAVCFLLKMQLSWNTLNFAGKHNEHIMLLLNNTHSRLAPIKSVFFLLFLLAFYTHRTPVQQLGTTVKALPSITQHLLLINTLSDISIVISVDWESFSHVCSLLKKGQFYLYSKTKLPP